MSTSKPVLAHDPSAPIAPSSSSPPPSDFPPPPSPATRIPTLDFDPPPHIATQILADFLSPASSLGLIAEKANTSVELLSLWLARPDIAARIDAVEATLRRRARLQIVNFAGNIYEACATIVDRYRRSPDRGPRDLDDPRTHAIHTRNASNALMASRVLIHMRRYLDDSLPAARQRTPRPALAPDAAPDPAPARADESPSRLSILPPLPDVGLNLPDLRQANTTTPNTPTRDNAPATLQPEGLTGNSRGLSESSSDTPGQNAALPPHPEGVQPANERPPKPCACPTTKSHASNPCHSCSSVATSPSELVSLAGRPHRAREPTPATP